MIHPFLRKNIINLFIFSMKRRYIFYSYKNSNIISGKNLKFYDIPKLLIKKIFFLRLKKCMKLNIFHEKDVLAIPPYGLPITKRGQIVLSPFHTSSRKIFIRTLRYLGLKSFLKIYLTFIFCNRYERKEKSVFFLIPRHGYKHNSPNYCHWMTENLPQIRSLAFLNPNTKILVNQNLKKYQNESLKYLDKILEPRKIIKYDNKPTFIKNLYFSSIEDQVYGPLENIQNSDPYSRLWIRDKIISAKNFKIYTNSEKIFVMRDPKERRQIINFEDFKTILNKYNFQLYQPGINGFENDVKKFNRCKIVLGLNGAGLVNILFMRNGHLIELIPSCKSHDYWFSTLSKELKHIKYHRFECDDRKNINSNEDVEIDLIEFEKKLTSILAEID